MEIVKTYMFWPLTKSFLGYLEDKRIKKAKKWQNILFSEYYILGDINIDFKIMSSTLFKKYQQLLNIFHCKQLINVASGSRDNEFCW